MENMDREELIKQPDGTTEFPFNDVQHEKPASQDADADEQQFFFGKRPNDGVDDRVKKVAKVCGF